MLPEATTPAGRSSAQDDDAEYDAALHSATACGACGEEAPGNLDDGICEECQKVLQTPKKPCCKVWKKLSNETVSRIVVNRCLQGAVSESGSYAHKKITDSVICVLSKLDTSVREFWQVTTASLLQSLQAHAEYVLPSQYDDDELKAVFYDLLSLCTSWTPKIVTYWTKVFSDADTGMLIMSHLTETKPELVIEKAGSLCSSLKALVAKVSCCNSELVDLDIIDADTRSVLLKSCAKVAKALVEKAIRSPKTMWQVTKNRLDAQAKCKTTMGKLRSDLVKSCVPSLTILASAKMIVCCRVDLQ